MTVKLKLIMILALLLVVFAGTSLLTFLQLNAQVPQLIIMEKQAAQVSASNVPLLSTVKQIKFHVVQVQQWLTDISATRGQDGLNDGLEVAAEQAAHFKTQMVKARALAEGLKLTEVVKLLDDAAADFPPYFETGVRMANSYIADGPAGGNKMMAEFDGVAAKIGEVTDNITEKVASITTETLTHLNQQSVSVAEANAALINFVLILTAVGVVIALVGAVTLFNLISSGLSGLESDIEAIASKNNDVPLRLDINGTDEFGTVARALADFRVKLIEMDQMKVEQEQTERRTTEERRQMRNSMADELENKVKTVVEVLKKKTTDIIRIMGSMGEKLDAGSNRSLNVTEAANRTNTNVGTVSAAAEELSSSINEISRQVAQSSRIASAAAADAQHTDEKIQGLATAANKIGEVVALITDIADQTNLLALNATIEAARAGDAGKGFAVVASEVKNLANQTAKATEEIGAQIGAIQNATQEAVTAIKGIAKTIAEVNEISAGIAAAVEEQGAATNEIARNVRDVSVDAEKVSDGVIGVTRSSAASYGNAIEALWAAEDIVEPTAVISNEVDAFISNVRRG